MYWQAFRCASVLSLVLSLVMPPRISQAIANDAQTVSTEETVDRGSQVSTDVDNATNWDTENQNSDDAEGGEGEDAAAADPSADDTWSRRAAQPADDAVFHKAATGAK